MGQNVTENNNVYSVFVNISNNYNKISKPEITLFIHEAGLNSEVTNESKLPFLLPQCVKKILTLNI